MIKDLNIKNYENKEQLVWFGVINKINELVDAVNEFEKDREEIKEWIAIVGDLRKQVRELQAKVNKLAPNINFAQPEVKENVQDKFAEQRKWIDCLVEYGNADDGFRYGILTNIEPRYSAYPFEIDNGRDAAADCWLPSKTIFYKGGDNE